MTPDDDPDRCQIARLYRDLGWSVIPLNVGHKRTSQRWTRWQKELPPCEWIAQQWPPGSRRNVGVVCGAVSGGLVVRDWDDAEAYETWRGAHPELATTIPTVETRRGRHQYVLASDGRTGSLTFSDGELKGDGCYVVVAGSSVSRDRSGAQIEPHVYRWTVPLTITDGKPILPVLDLAESGLIPDVSCVLHSHLTQHPQHPHAGGPGVGLGDSAVAALVERHSITGKGQRNNSLWRLALDVKARVRVPDDDLAEQVLRAWLACNRKHCGTSDWLANWEEFRSMLNRASDGKAFLSRVGVVFERTEVPEVMRGHRGGDKLDRIIRVLVAADVVSGGESFFMSVRDMASIAGDVSPPTARSGARHLVALGWLRLVRAGTRGQRGRANEYQLVRRSEE